MTTNTSDTNIPGKIAYAVSVRRCNRWDVYPQNEPAETVTVMIRPRKPNEEAQRWAGRVADALADQYPKWRVSAPVLVSVVEMAKLSQHCGVTNDHVHCPRETTLGTSACECPCHSAA